MSNSTSEADIIIVGAGAAGCVVAGRLSAAAPQLRILVLEEGSHTLNDPLVRTPGMMTTYLAPNSGRTTLYVAEPSSQLLGPPRAFVQGKCVGGGSAINIMMYTRGAASDYDDWANKHDNPGWSFKDLEPLFKKTETYEFDPIAPSHGGSGPLKVSHGGSLPGGGTDWTDTALAYDKSRGFTNDANDFKTIDAYHSTWPKWIGSDGKRSDAAHGFLYPQMALNPNLTVIDEAKVVKVIFEDTRAVGVEFITSVEGKHTVQVARASRLVILSAGALGTPQILERSGIGSQRILDNAGVTTFHELVGVGENYQDHQSIRCGFIASHDVEQRDAIYRSEPEAVNQAKEQYAQNGSGVFGTNPVDAGIKIRPDPKDVGRKFSNEPHVYERSADKALAFISTISGLLLPIERPKSGCYMTGSIFTWYPLSRGSIHICSSDPSSVPVFHTGFLEHPADIAPLMWAYKHLREISRRLPRYRGEIPQTHPAFAYNSEAACGPADEPVPMHSANILYTADDDKALETWIRKNVATTYHCMGTCAMKAEATGGVVDSRLNVYGTEALKLADLSICPGNVGANTYSTALVIGEKAAILIAEELGLQMG